MVKEAPLDTSIDPENKNSKRKAQTKIDQKQDLKQNLKILNNEKPAKKVKLNKNDKLPLNNEENKKIINFPSKNFIKNAKKPWVSAKIQKRKKGDDKIKDDKVKNKNKNEEEKKLI